MTLSPGNPSSSGTRPFSPYEQNHLRRHGVDPETIGEYGDMPVEYITGFAEIYGREFVVTRDTLIPRVEEEDLIRLAIDGVSKREALSGTRKGRKEIRIADVGTGCGVLGITLFLELEARGMTPDVYLSDVSEAALAVARINVDQLVSKPHHIRLLRSDLFMNYERNNHEPITNFDLIVANLPYIPSGRIASLPSSVRDYEPHLALDGGPDGLRYVNRMLKEAPVRLAPRGVMMLEIDETHAKRFSPDADNIHVRIEKDSFGTPRFLVLSN